MHLISTLFMFLSVSTLVPPAQAEDTSGAQQGGDADLAQELTNPLADLMPTILEMVNVKNPDTYNGKKVLPMKGKSLVNVLSGENEYAYAPDEYIGGEMLNGKWMRKGDYKAELVTKPYGPNVWQLYDLSKDPGETTDISSTHPEILDELKLAWDKYADEVGVFLGVK